MVKKIALLILVAAFVALALGVAAADNSVVVTGTITDDGVLVDEEAQVYVLVDTDAGLELMDLVGEQVKVKGELEETSDGKFLAVESFEKIEK